MGSKRSDTEDSDSSDGASNWRRRRNTNTHMERRTASTQRSRRSFSQESREFPARETRNKSTSPNRQRSPLRERRKSTEKQERRKSPEALETRRSPKLEKRMERRSPSEERHRSSPRLQRCGRDRDRKATSPDDSRYRRRDRSSRSPGKKHSRDKSSRKQRRSSSRSASERRSFSEKRDKKHSRHRDRKGPTDSDTKRRGKPHRSSSRESASAPPDRTASASRKTARHERSKSVSSSCSSTSDPQLSSVQAHDHLKRDQRTKYDDYLEREQSRKKDDKKKLKALLKETETPEQKRARRLAKKEAKERRRKQEMGWNDEYAGYSNQDNPFGDSNLLQTFKWGKKLEKEGLKDIKDEQLERLNRKKREEQRQELEKVKERRLERERERTEREELLEMEQRKREGAQFEEWAKQEDTFHLQQAKLRSKIRIEEGRAKPIDLLARYISAEEEDFSVEMIEPYLYLNGLTLDDFEDLIEDINVYMRLESRKNQGYWNDIRIIVDEEVRKFKRTEGEENSSGRQAISSEVSKEIVNVFKGKTPKQLEAMKNKIEIKLKNKGPGLDVAYWETLLSRLRSYMAHARLRERHEENLRKKLAQLKQEQGVEMKQERDGDGDGDDDHQRQGPSQASTAQNAEQALSSADDDNSQQEACDDIDPLQQSIDDYEQGKYSPILLRASELELGTLLIDPQEDEHRREARISLMSVGKVETLTKIEEIFEREARKGMDDAEAQFSVEQLIDAQTYQWSDMYRPRKPRYFNRVHTGFEWNKYNQTHYDIDNPPPKIVQGYKFNIFYPDLIDKNQTPQYSLTACADNSDFSVLRFHAGPPYEDIAFKVVNREWEYSYKKGFRCQFHNDIFQLWFHFKRYRYRR